MKCVIDTSVLIAAMLGDEDACKIFDKIKSGELCWYVGKDILHEYRLMISRGKFNFSEDTVRHWKTVINRYSHLVQCIETLKFSRDPSDSRFISLAVQVDADYLITSDKAILAAEYKLKAEIFVPNKFIRQVFGAK